MLEELEENELTERIIGLAIEVHKEYGGPGLKESAYGSDSSSTSGVRPCARGSTV